MKKIFSVFIAMALLLLSNCSDLFIHRPDTASGQETEITIPEGFAGLEITFDQGPARTAMPSVVISSFHHIEYLFSRNGETPVALVPQGNLFIIEPGNYQVTVNAYLTLDAGSLAAFGDSTFVINADQIHANVPVTMHPFVTGEGNGTFEFSIAYPGGVTVDKYTLTRIAGNESYNLLANSTATGGNPVTRSGKISVPIGYYLLEVKLINTGGEHAEKIEVVHIYRNLLTATKLDDYTFTTGHFISDPPPPIPVITINAQPAAVTTVTYGSIGNSLSIAATVTQGATLSYQWYSNTSSSNTGGTSVPSGGKAASFTIPATLRAGTYYYYVVVSASGGGGVASVTSGVAKVVVKGRYLIALTFDDGPDDYTDSTIRVLNMLDKYGVKGTFFVIGWKIDSSTTPILQRMVRDGHSVQNHTWDHLYLAEVNLTRTQIIAQINNTSNAIHTATGVWPIYFRPPAFSYGAAMEGIDRETTPKLPWIFCGIDTEDWVKGKSSKAIADEVLNVAKSKSNNSGADGAIVLQHDGIYDRSPDTSGALDIFIPQMMDWGYEFVTLSELYERKEETPVWWTWIAPWGWPEWPNTWVGPKP